MLEAEEIKVQSCTGIGKALMPLQPDIRNPVRSTLYNELHTTREPNFSPEVEGGSRETIKTKWGDAVSEDIRDYNEGEKFAKTVRKAANW